VAYYTWTTFLPTYASLTTGRNIASTLTGSVIGLILLVITSANLRRALRSTRPPYRAAPRSPGERPGAPVVVEPTVAVEGEALVVVAFGLLPSTVCPMRFGMPSTGSNVRVGQILGDGFL
jgi:hypothetical protein